MRQAGFRGGIVLIGEEAYVPYERPPLSKELLATDADLEKVFCNPPDYYAQNGIELRLETRATSVNRAAGTVCLESGETIAYDRLLIVTGGRVRRLDCPGEELEGLHYIRAIPDTLALRPALREGARVVVIGGGFIGLEVAASARMRGCAVTVVELADQVLARVADPAVGDLVAALHRKNGVRIMTGASVERITGHERVDELVCTDGEILAADVVVVGIGILPNVEIAANAGLAVANGITVDEFGRTSDANIFAAGDVAFHYNPLLGHHLRLESWANAQNAGVAVGRNVVADPEPYAEIPWFWTDQFDLNMPDRRRTGKLGPPCHPWRSSVRPLRGVLHEKKPCRWGHHLQPGPGRACVPPALGNGHRIHRRRACQRGHAAQRHGSRARCGTGLRGPGVVSTLALRALI